MKKCLCLLASTILAFSSLANAQNTLQWTLSYVIRGAHKLEAKWFAKDGSVLAVSEPITVFVLRPSIL